MQKLYKKLILLLLAAMPLNLAAADAAAVQAAETAARQWVSMVDRGDYQASWQAAASLFQSGVSAQQWATSAQQARAPFGALQKRELRSASRHQSLPGVADGDYVVLVFDAKYQQRAATETITQQFKQGAWKTAGYFIR